MVRVLFRAAAFLAILPFFSAVGYFVFRSHAASPVTEARHGLTANYYVGVEWDKDLPPALGISAQFWSDPNDFNLPRTFTWTSIAPAATRVDAQVAFGQGKGFQANGGGSAKPWLPTGSPTGAVIWKGYIHLPKAGTYYFGTISHGPSAVYVNQARVALNGTFGGVLVADAFSYAQEEVRDYVQNRSSGNANVLTGLNARDQYVVPVSIDAPRDLPMEVQYNWAAASGHEYEGIDLFWVTPDSPRDANGKPIAKIVPSEVLFTEPPSTIEKPAVRSANSTIEADHLYFPTEYTGESVTVKVRLADKEGNPMVRKRVYVSSLTSYGNSDAITQPEKPTDKNGETTAKIRANATYAVEHDSAIFATDITDLVDIAQVGHVTFLRVGNTFFPDALSPYYDRRFSITPLPPVVGRPATLKTLLTNQSKFPATVTVTFLTTDWNIGFTNFEEITEVKDLTLRPGESKEISTTFVPKEVMSHKCYRVEVRGRYLAAGSSGGKGFATVMNGLFLLVDVSGKVRADLVHFEPARLAQQGAACGPYQHYWDPKCPWPAPEPTPGQEVSENTQHNTETLVDWAAKKMGGDKIPCGTIPGCSIDPKTGLVHFSYGAHVSVNEHDVGGVDVGGSFGAEQSPDPHKILQWEYHGTVDVGGHETTVFKTTGVVSAPAISKDIDPNVSPCPQFNQLRQLEL